METVKVYSPILDTNIRKNLGNSLIWDKVYHEDEEMPDGPIHEYHFKFEGTVPVQVTKVPKGMK